MDTGAELTTLTSAAAGQLVHLMTADGWSAMKSSVGSLWHRSHRRQTEMDLELSRQRLLAVIGSVDEPELRAALRKEWQARLAALLVADLKAAEQLRALLGPSSKPTPATQSQAVGTLTITAHVSGGGNANIAARDQTINHQHHASTHEDDEE